MIHTGEKPFECGQCDMKFITTFTNESKMADIWPWNDLKRTLIVEDLIFWLCVAGVVEI